VPIARKMGFNELVYGPDLGIQVQGNGLATTRAFIKTNRDIVRRALKGYVEGIYFIFHDKKSTQRVFAKYMRTDDPDVLESSYAAYVKTTAKQPHPTMKGLQFLLDALAPQMPQARSAKPEQFVDLSFLQELEREDFFTQMAKRYPAN
jgi:ABC-type nitrate/sulfonate/bicarbonate transport system substrate-binding protein